jgi:hypothetical protein
MQRVIGAALAGTLVGAGLGCLPGLREPSWLPLSGSDVGHALRHFQRDLVFYLGLILGGACGGLAGALAGLADVLRPRGA